MANILSLSNTTGSPVTIPATGAPATLITYQLGENNYQAVELKATILLTTTGTSTAQSIIFEFKSSGTVIESIAKNTKAVVDDIIIPIIVLARINGKGPVTLTVRANGGTADANSAVTVQNTYILGHF